MATNLILNHGFEGFLFDGEKENVNGGIAFFKEREDSRYLPPCFQQAWITRENVNQLLRGAEASGEVDFLRASLIK